MLLWGCEKNPMRHLINPLSDGALGNVSWGEWVVYDDDVKTRGDIMLSPTDAHQVIEEVSENPYSGKRCLKYYWDGEKIDRKDWVAAIFTTQPNWQYYQNPVAVDLSSGAYTKITFYARGNTIGNTKVIIKGPRGSGQTPDTNSVKMEISVESNWQKYTFNISNSDLTNVQQFFTIVFQNENSSPGGATLYIDEIKYIP